MKICIYTLGCKVNQYESGGLHKALMDNGHEVVEELCYADCYIVNTCAVTAEAERKSRNTITKCLSYNGEAKVFIIGCASQNNSNQFEIRDNVHYVNGNGAKKKVIDLIENGGESFEKDILPTDFEDFKNTVNSRTRAFVKVQDGCNNFCSYCIVPYLRGRSRSRDIESCIEEIQALEHCNEVVLCGINLSDYKYGGLHKLAEAVDKIGIRFRFGSLEVNVITDEFLASMAKLNNFCPQFHLSLQSGSTEVLAKMNRHYKAEDYINACDKIKATFEKANITTDVIVGFPGESEENFNESVELAKRVEFGDMHIFPYSRREGTVAGKLSDMPKAIKKERVEKLIAVKDMLKTAYINKYVGKTLTVLTEEHVDNYTVGHTENFIKIYLDGEIEDNKLIDIVIVEPFRDGAKGEIKICD